MTRFLLPIAFAVIAPLFTMAQVASIRLTLIAPVGTDTTKDIYLAGNFNNWLAGDPFYRMKKQHATTYTLELPAFKGRTYEYKYNLGKWSEVELAGTGMDVPNRVVQTVKKKICVSDTVAQWKRPAPPQNKPSLPPAFAAKKDSLLASLQPRVADMLNLLKAYVDNLLQPQPSAEKQREIRETLRLYAAEASGKIHSLCAGVANALTPAQKERIRAALANPNQKGDFINTLLAALGEALQEQPAAAPGGF